MSQRDGLRNIWLDMMQRKKSSSTPTLFIRNDQNVFFCKSPKRFWSVSLFSNRSRFFPIGTKKDETKLGSALSSGLVNSSIIYYDRPGDAALICQPLRAAKSIIASISSSALYLYTYAMNLRPGRYVYVCGFRVTSRLFIVPHPFTFVADDTMLGFIISTAAELGDTSCRQVGFYVAS